MSIQSVSPTATSSTSKSTSNTMVDKNAFLNILVAQLKHQDPMDPMKADQFMTQLAQLTQVEELQNISGTLEKMQAATSNQNVTQWLSAIGKKMNVDDTVMSKGDEIAVTPAGDYDRVVLSLTDTKTGEATQVTLNKGDALAYTYQGEGSVTVTAAASKNGTPVSCQTSLGRVVKGVEVGNSGIVMVAGSGESYTVDKVKQIRE